MGIYSNYIIESTLSINKVAFSDNIFNELCNEFDNFNKICESINILSENSIILENVDFNKIKEKIKNAWTKLKEWFKNNVINRIKAFISEIKKSASDYIKTINSLKTLKRSLPDVEFKAKEIYQHVKNDGEITVDNITDLVDIKFSEENYNESTILESSQFNNQKIITIARLVKPQLFFKADNYIDFKKYNRYFELNSMSMKNLYTLIIKNNGSTAISDDDLDKFESFSDNLNSNNDFFIGVVKGNTINNIDTVINNINEDLEYRMPKNISLDSLIDLVEENIKNSEDELSCIQKSIDNITDVSKEVDKMIEDNNTDKFTVKLLKDSMSMYRNNINMIYKLLSFCTSMYDTSKNMILKIKVSFAA